MAPHVRALGRLAWQILRYRCLRGGWLPDYLRRQRLGRRWPGDRPIDLLVLVADHFEPPMHGPPHEAAAIVASWCRDYEQIASRHRDADGRPPQHTWFYPAENPQRGCLAALSRSVFRGFGEVEFHLHHAHDTHASFAAKLDAGLPFFHQAGAMRSAERQPQTHFAYVAGNWALDNGAGDDAISGCNTELRALRDAGCYADFTFPALGSPAQPRMVNTIYYATDGPEPKSYDTGTEVEVGRTSSGDLMIVPGPLALDWRRGWFDWGPLESYAPPSADRLAIWLKAHVHVRGRPEWIFVKLHTHGLQSRSAFLSPALDAMFEAMGRLWNRSPFRLHYVTAREAYNIIKAAEAGLAGNAGAFRDFLIPPPAGRFVRCDQPWRLHSFTPQRMELHVDTAAQIAIALQMRDSLPRFVAGGVFPDAVEMELPANGHLSLEAGSLLENVRG